MRPPVQADSAEVKKFIYDRVMSHPRFKAVIAVSVERYPSEFSAVVWVGQEPDAEMRRYTYELEAELANLGVPCSIIVKTDRELPFGGSYALRTRTGEFTYRYYKLDPTRDEDVVYIFVLYQGTLTYRFRLSMSGTLASMLRSRNRLDEERIREMYLDWIRGETERRDLKGQPIEEKMFDSRDVNLFAVG